MSDEELERLRAEKKANKRGFLAGFLDPFHLWGPKGYIGKRLVKKPSETNTELPGNITVETKAEGQSPRTAV